MTYTTPAQHLVVRTEYDVVTMRQQLRQQARALGLGLIEQAKLATAITAVARRLLALEQTTTFVMQTTTDRQRPALEIGCKVDLGMAGNSSAQIEETLGLDEARLLVDEVDIARDYDNISLTLCLWLGNPSR